MDKSNRPLSIVVSCIAILFLSGDLLLGIVQRPIPTEAEILPVFVGVIAAICFGCVIAIFIWRGKGWMRWVYVLWLLIPMVSVSLGDVVIVGGDFAEQFARKLIGLFTSVFGLTSVAAILLLFLPASNRWFRECR